MQPIVETRCVFPRTVESASMDGVVVDCSPAVVTGATFFGKKARHGALGVGWFSFQLAVTLILQPTTSRADDLTTLSVGRASDVTEARFAPALDATEEAFIFSEVRKRLESNRSVCVVEMKRDLAYAGANGTVLVDVVLAGQDGSSSLLGVLVVVKHDSNGKNEVLSVAYVD